MTSLIGVWVGIWYLVGMAAFGSGWYGCPPLKRFHGLVYVTYSTQLLPLVVLLVCILLLFTLRRSSSAAAAAAAELFEHRRVLQHVRDDDEPHLAATQEDVLELADAPVARRVRHGRQLHVPVVLALQQRASVRFPSSQLDRAHVSFAFVQESHGHGDTLARRRCDRHGQCTRDK